MQSGFVKRQLFFRRFMVFEATLSFTRFYILELYRPMARNTVKLGCTLSPLMNYLLRLCPYRRYGAVSNWCYI